MTLSVARPRKIRGEIIAPGDKSVSHRAVMFNAIADGVARITNFSPGADCTSTVSLLRSLGVEIEREPGPDGQGDSLTVTGRGMNGLEEPADILDAGNSGTTTRLMSGILAGRKMLAVLTGDDSLRSRPMGRVVRPLTEMGAVIRGRHNDSLAPLVFAGGQLRGIEFTMPVASAQLKSTILLAGLRALDKTRVHQPAASRDHTERMLTAMGADIKSYGLDVEIQPTELSAVDVEVPGDISSAAFWMVAGAAHPDAEIMIRGVGVNPTRSGVIDVLKAMGADLTLEHQREVAGEPVADIFVRSSRLRGTDINGDIIPLLIDEVPVLAVAAAMAEGQTNITDAGELRVKETDRIAATIDWLTGAGIECEGHADGLTIQGSGHVGGGKFNSYDDHRIAMSLGVAGLVSDSPITVLNGEVAGISYPGFWKDIGRLGGLVG
ncbi:MAG: 3-phosphoshikimate 1-carboxyvinyltransferase [Dehalococcoidia bacterium]